MFNIQSILLNMKRNQYSIKDLENLTSIKAHTIRIWEQRYNLLQPKRTDTNIRYYEDDDLRKILNINLLYSNGFKISKIAKLSENEILSESRKLIMEKSQVNDEMVDLLLMSIIELDENKTYGMLLYAFEEKSIEELYTDIIIPLLHKIGELWQLNTISIGHEHFFSNLLRAFFLAKTSELKIEKKVNKKVMMFLRPGEEHELSLLLYNFIFKREGWQVIYLGSNVPYKDLKLTYDQMNPDLILTSFIARTSKGDFQKILTKVLDNVPKEKMILSGYTSVMYKDLIPKEVSIIENQEDFENIFV